MKTIARKKSTIVVVVSLISLVLTQPAFAYPPDNAAILYYRACLSYQADEEMEGALSDLHKGKTELDDQIREYVEKNRYVINLVLDASEVRNCDWGLDYSDGLAVLAPPLNVLRKLGRLVIADGKILAEEGDYEAALSRCVSVRKMGRHVGEPLIIDYLVGISLGDLANKGMQSVLADMSPDLQTLRWLKNQLAEIETRPLLAKAAISEEAKFYLAAMQKEKAEEILKMFSDNECSDASVPNQLLERIRNGDEDFFERNRIYWQDIYGQAMAALDLPYPQAYLRLKEIGEEPARDANSNPDATLSAILQPALGAVYSIGVRFETFSNAVRSAVDIYIIHAETGRLPDGLPAGLPKDLFSGGDFEYEKKTDGFVLRCQAKDLDKDKLHEYEFKMRK
ncbi:MAG TPA: hypothetical protein VMX13_05900 [Sedimentisphaerales bacterium]|nr:hypothetical protein [Sedimentisphaerales bacterium]